MIVELHHDATDLFMHVTILQQNLLLQLRDSLENHIAIISIIKNIMTLSVLKPVASLKGGAPCSAVENGLPHTRWQ